MKRIFLIFLFFSAIYGKPIGSGFFDYSLNNIIDSILLPVFPCDHWTSDTASGVFIDRVGYYPGIGNAAEVCTTGGWWSPAIKFHGTGPGLWCGNDINFVSQQKLCIAVLVGIYDTGGIQCIWTKGTDSTNRMSLYVNYGRINFDVGNASSGTLKNFNVGMHKFPGLDPIFPIIISMDFTQPSGANRVRFLIGPYDASENRFASTSSGNMPTTTTSSTDSLWIGSFGSLAFPMRANNYIDEMCAWQIDSQLQISQMQAIAISMMNAIKFAILGQSNNRVAQNVIPYKADFGGYEIKYAPNYPTIRQLVDTRSNADSGSRSPYPGLEIQLHAHSNGRPIVLYSGSVDSHGLTYSDDGNPWIDITKFPWQDAMQWGRVYQYDHWPLVIADWQEDALVSTITWKTYADSALVFYQRWCDSMHTPGTIFGISYFGRINNTQRDDSTIDQLRKGVFFLVRNYPDKFILARNGIQYGVSNETQIGITPVHGTSASTAGNWFKGQISGKKARTNYGSYNGPLFLVSNDHQDVNFVIGEEIWEYKDSLCDTLANAKDTVTSILQKGHYKTERQFNLCGKVHLYDFCRYLNGELPSFGYPMLTLQNAKYAKIKDIKVKTAGNVDWSVAGGDYTRGWEGFNGTAWITPAAAAKKYSCVELTFNDKVTKVRYMYNSIAGLNYHPTTLELISDSMDNQLITDANQRGAISHIYYPITDTIVAFNAFKFSVQCSLSTDILRANIYLQTASSNLSFTTVDSAKSKNGGFVGTFADELSYHRSFYRFIVQKSVGGNDTTVNYPISKKNIRRKYYHCL